MGRDILINAHSVIPLSRVNGPGKRMVIFFQGCALNCPGCFNPETHPFKTGSPYSSENPPSPHPSPLRGEGEYRWLMNVPPEELLREFLSPDIEGITVSGGEPFYQARGLLHLLKIARTDYGLSTVVYTGFTYERLNSTPLCRSAFRFIDVLIDGEYEAARIETTLLARGSTNQRFHFFSKRYQQKDFYMPAKAEIIIGRDGTIRKTGFSSEQ